ncbi:MAG: ATP-binding protein [Lachnospiraceae bacterium]|nr:ATP-binding protein [Lachnospiraceae bacterium]
MLNNDQNGLLDYLKNYMDTVPAGSPLLYCKNSAVNALIVYYADLAQKHEIIFDANTDYPTASLLSDADAVVLLGNLLENAMDACTHQMLHDKFIHLRIKAFQEMLIITLDNSYSGQIHKEGAEFISSKNGQKGIGTVSVKKIVSKYNGILKFNYDDNQFHASVMLRISQKEGSYEQKTY